jgi:cyclopropane-fatty-acyl-phospholipid synthase
VIDRICRWLLSRFLRRIAEGSLTVLEDGSRRVYGSGPPAATIYVRSGRMWRMAISGSRGLADAYADGHWDSPDLVALVRLAARSASGLDRLRRRLAPVRAPVQRVRALLWPSTKLRRRRDIAAHYDLGNQLFSRMLDPTMSYSCAVFERA